MKARAAGGVVAQREQLLELVDDDAAAPAGRARRAPASAPGVTSDGVVDPGDLAGARGGDEAGAQHRGLAAARGADDGEQPAGREPADESATTSSRPKKKRAVAGLEGEQAAVRAVGDRRRRVGRPGPRARGCAPARRAP